MTPDAAPRRSTGSLLLAVTLAFFWLQAPAVTPADAATISIPGAVSPAQASGASVTNLVPGTHAAQFSNLAAWQEPDAAELLVIGGKQSTVTATYRPLPRFYFRDVPGQSARVGKVLEFLVRSDDPGDPQNPGPGVPLQMTATPPPAGALAFDAGNGRLTYSPSVAESTGRAHTCGRLWTLDTGDSVVPRPHASGRLRS